MLHLHSHDIEHQANEASLRPARWTFVLVALGAAALLLVLLGTLPFDGLDRLVPDGQPFLPYFTT